jgi:uncharacterized protein
MNRQFGPSQAGERIQTLDILRGFALFGILLMNIEYFQRPLIAIMLGFDGGQAGVDHAAAWFSFTFIEGKFYTLFSMLFGMGFVIFLDRAMQRGAPARLLFARRLAVLFLIGLVHAFFVWSGDILWSYGLVGFLLLLFTRTPARRLWKWGLGFFILPLLLLWLTAFSIEAALHSPHADEMRAVFDADRAKLIADVETGELIYRDGSWLEVTRWRAYEFSSLYGGGVLFYLLSFLGMFLIGASFARAGVFHAIEAHRTLFRRLLVVGYGTGLPGALIWGLLGTEMDMLFPTLETAALFTLQAATSIALCLAYMSTVVLLSRRAGSVLKGLAPMGRMALTNYLTHSIVFTLIFYGYGLGLYGEIGRAGATAMALALLAFQVGFSRWWLQRFEMGPMERLWRVLTYGRRAATDRPAPGT